MCVVWCVEVKCLVCSDLVCQGAKNVLFSKASIFQNDASAAFGGASQHRTTPSRKKHSPSRQRCLRRRHRPKTAPCQFEVNHGCSYVQGILVKSPRGWGFYLGQPQTPPQVVYFRYFGQFLEFKKINILVGVFISASPPPPYSRGSPVFCNCEMGYLVCNQCIVHQVLCSTMYSSGIYINVGLKTFLKDNLMITI